jgi:APA family basic amino acid/polyamine antiporter
MAGGAIVFFSYIGFDCVTTAAEESRQPDRDMPIGILGSLVICTILYILVAGILTGMVPYTALNVREPIAVGIDVIGIPALGVLIKIGAIAGLSSVMLVMMMGMARVFFSVARDGLLPPVFGRVHPRFRTPYVTTILTGAVAAGFAGLVPIGILGELVSIGTLLAFVIVCAGVWFLRVKEPERPRPFRTPMVPLVPILGILVCLALMASLPLDTWLRLLIWLAIGLAIYFGYGRRHSLVQLAAQAPGAPRGPGSTEPRSGGGGGRRRGRRGGRGRR